MGFNAGKKTFAILILAAASISLLAAVDPDPRVGTTLTITGCLHAGKAKDQFVLVGVTEKLNTGETAPTLYAIFWLSDMIVEKMSPLVGQLVDVTGLIVKRDTTRGVITVDIRPDAEASTKVTVAEGNVAPITTETYAGGPDSPMLVRYNRPVYQLKVLNAVAVNFNKYGPACK